ncbi:ParB family chromosome partitioning protein [Novosphingobium hassiacum]|uniref:ParB family chromosome partitioning protein n=1 Tax=Novosphingobium hassiacum TaxID=173676 RepID=A0A7W6EY12_9SPHN|nr:ParB/RepB/Spo0J family partition protein [Novosphingobium hassiacum]MBB3862952.1 ParB family chromosome partitioning protein [Novosphingobium hassiacum]
MIRTIPLNKLVQSPRNVRKHSDAAADAELAASIAALGLLQNLIVRPAAKGKFEVEAGERRRRAMLALADDKVLPRDHQVTCLVLEDTAEAAVETSLAENFHRLAMNPADEAVAFASLIEGGASIEDVARRFGLTVRFVEGRLRLAKLAPVVFEALAGGEITLDLAKAYGATSDQTIQAQVFEQVSSAYYAPNPDSVRRMVLSGTVRGNDPRARLVGRDAYLAAGGRIERELFDDHDSEAWADVALLENLASAKMDEQAKALAAEQGLAWVKPTLDPYASHDLVDGLVRLPAEPAPLTEAELARLDELDASYDEHAAILEDEDSAEEAVAAAEAAIEAIERECQDIRSRPPVLSPELKGDAGMILTLSRDGTPVLQPVFYGERQSEGPGDDDGIEVVAGSGGNGPRRAALSKRLVDELAMQRRDVLALHVASDPGLALDLLVFTLADGDTIDWRARSATTIRGGVPAGPIVGFEAKDAPASAALADLKGGLDESWRAGEDVATRFDRFRSLGDDARAAWLGFVVGRTFEASLNMAGDRHIALQDRLGCQIGIDMAQWWRPTAANYFDRVSKQIILDALADVGGPELSARFASVKKTDLAMSAERVFAGTYITEAEVRDRAIAWVPEVMRFADPAEPVSEEQDELDAEAKTPVGSANDDCPAPREMAA